MLEMYAPIVNSPITELATAIDDTQTTIEVVDGSKLPDAPNLAMIGLGEDTETILYTAKSGNVLSGVTRGFQGTAKGWPQGARIARFFSAYDQNAIQQNIQTLKQEQDEHLNETVSDDGGVHGFKVEEGTFTPFVNNVTTYSNREGYYIKQGKIVTITLNIGFPKSELSDGQLVQIRNLPFLNKYRGAASITRITGVSDTERSIKQITAWIVEDTNIVSLAKLTDVVTTGNFVNSTMQKNDLLDFFEICISATYQTDDD